MKPLGWLTLALLLPGTGRAVLRRLPAGRQLSPQRRQRLLSEAFAATEVPVGRTPPKPLPTLSPEAELRGRYGSAPEPTYLWQVTKFLKDVGRFRQKPFPDPSLAKQVLDSRKVLEDANTALEVAWKAIPKGFRRGSSLPFQKALVEVLGEAARLEREKPAEAETLTTLARSLRVALDTQADAAGTLKAMGIHAPAGSGNPFAGPGRRSARARGGARLRPPTAGACGTLVAAGSRRPSARASDSRGTGGRPR